MRFKIAIAALMLATIPVIVQAAPFDRYSILVNTEPANMPPGSLVLAGGSNSGRFSGTIGDHRLEGFYASDSRHIVWVRFSANRPIQAFVGAYTEQEIGRFGVSREIRGIVYALNAAGGASPQRNAFGFRAWNNFALRERGQPSRNPNPAVSLNSKANRAGAWWVTANNAQAPMVLEVGPDGAVSGRLFGDPIAGHYAADAGTIAFLRLRNNQPIQLYDATQFYQAVSVRKPIGGSTPEFDGSFVALNSDGGASSFDIDFPFNARNQDTFTAYTSRLNGLCLEIANGALGDRAQLRLGPCTGVTHQQFALVRSIFGDPTGAIVARHSGRCLDVPFGATTPGSIVQQYSCHGANNQRTGLVTLFGGACPRGFAGCAAIKFFLRPEVCLTARRMAGTDDIVTGSNCSIGRPEIQFERAPTN